MKQEWVTYSVLDEMTRVSILCFEPLRALPSSNSDCNLKLKRPTYMGKPWTILKTIHRLNNAIHVEQDYFIYMYYIVNDSISSASPSVETRNWSQTQYDLSLYKLNTSFEFYRLNTSSELYKLDTSSEFYRLNTSFELYKLDMSSEFYRLNTSSEFFLLGCWQSKRICVRSRQRWSRQFLVRNKSSIVRRDESVNSTRQILNCRKLSLISRRNCRLLTQKIKHTRQLCM